MRRQLLAAGLSEGRIYTAGLCTFCDAARFHSFRRDREKAGRMISFIAVKSAPENS
jgi:copper oxidase (laccase) domain-containing protein